MVATGAIYFATGGTGRVENCNFINNTASSGVAIYFETGRDGIVKNCNFVDNTATSNGGAVYFSSSGSVENCNFTNNKASGYGGAIWMNTGTVTNCNFINNTAHLGGAVLFNGTSNVENCNFTNNSAVFGGAVYFNKKGEVTNCSFTDNTASIDGGAIRIFSGTVTNCNFTNNRATNEGGAISFADGGNVANCNFTDNTGNYGGAIKTYSGTVTNCNFTNNRATSKGGAVFFIGGGEVTNCNFTNNVAKYGGAIYFGNINTPNKVIGCNFTNNVASDDGGAVYFSKQGEVTNCSFTDNTATNGGAVYFNGTGDVRNCNFTGNNATNGSAIYFYTTLSTRTISNSSFLNNRANAKDLQVTRNEKNIIIFTGNNNLLNAIYSNGDVNLSNVTYWGANGINNTNSYTPSRSNREAGQNITVKGVVNGNIINATKVTDENGEIVLDAGDYWIIVGHKGDSYYTEVAETLFTNMAYNVNITSQTTNNKTVNITAKSNIFNEVMPGELLFILPDGNKLNANYTSNGTWWAVHKFDDYTEYVVNASYSELSPVTIRNGVINITKADSKLTIYDVVLDYGNSAEVIAITEGATGITAEINGTEVSGIYNFIIPISGLGGGNYTLTVTTVPDDDHKPVTKTATITVNKLRPEIILTNESINLKVMDIVSDFASLNYTGAGTLSFISGNENVVKIVDGKIIAVGGGKTTIIISFAGNDNYTAAETKYIVVNVSKFDTAIGVNVGIDGNNVAITVAVNSSASGLVKFNIDGKTVYVDLNDGEALYNIILPAGNYTVETTYIGDNRFNSNRTSNEFAVVGHVKNNTTISAIPNVDNFTVTIDIGVEKNATGFVTIAILGQTFMVPVNGGKAVFTYDFNLGTYSATVTYLDDDNFNNASTSVSFTVTKHDVGLKNTTIDVEVVTVNNNVTIVVNVDKSATGLIGFNIGGKSVYLDVNNGEAVYNIDLPAGDYTVVATYLGDSKFNSNKTSKAFTVSDHVKENTTITSDVVVDESNVTITINVDKELQDLLLLLFWVRLLLFLLMVVKLFSHMISTLVLTVLLYLIWVMITLIMQVRLFHLL